jgi:hypothetical protein
MIDHAKRDLAPTRPPPAARLRQEMTVFNARRQIGPLLQPGILAEDIRERLTAAVEAGSRLGPEIAAHLHGLRDLQLGPDASLIVVRAAANRAVERYVAARERGGKLSRAELDNIDVPDIPAKTFAREFAVALGNQVSWAADRRNSSQPSWRRQGSAAAQSQSGGPVGQRDEELAGLRAKAGWTVPGTSATNADLASLAEEFPTVEINQLRRILVDEFAERGVVREPGTLLGDRGRTFRVPVAITDVMNAIRSDLLPDIYGPASSQITGLAARDDIGELHSRWFAISQVWLDAILTELPVLNKTNIRLAFADITREISGDGSGVKAGPPLGLTWRRYGRGLQADAEAALNARLMALAEKKAKKSAEEAARKREAERAKEDAS